MQRYREKQLEPPGEEDEEEEEEEEQEQEETANTQEQEDEYKSGNMRFFIDEDGTFNVDMERMIDSCIKYLNDKFGSNKESEKAAEAS